ncbi:hypothetical protein PNEG_02678 [Pneumocystis murina B123]|uniref:Deacetylase sirtuin-type domain-containing protein n=1 Tax=Pneumocystis murina (strain B123) TaxID=1069680 RepID=M7P4X8_PNEMU|nr:hypothetical protein PNEG_02678 [Pneumocystis murina B123]EMR08895.1 hypothetical protein PNEG_02678 [Pneumocystis murina B123]
MIVKVKLDDENVKSRQIISKIIDIIEKSKKSVVITGSGISYDKKISGFSSSDGLYKFVEKRCPNVVIKAKDLLDSLMFRDEVSTSIFYSFMAELRTLILSAKPMNTYKFIKILRDRSSVLRCYTENIDGLGLQEELCLKTDEVKKNNMTESNEDVNKLKCMICGIKCDYSVERIELLRNGPVPDRFVYVNDEKIEEKRGALKIGFLRPGIVLYGNTHPIQDFLAELRTSDVKKWPDLLLIIGISLKIIAINSLIKDISKIVHSNGGKVIFVNRTEPCNNEWKGIIDWYVEADSDEWIEELKGKKLPMFMYQSKPSAFPIKKKKRSRKNGRNTQILSDVSKVVSPAISLFKKSYINYIRSSQKKKASNAPRINFSVPPPKMAPLVVTKNKIHVVCGNSKVKG